MIFIAGFILPLSFLDMAASMKLVSLNVTVPEGTRDHGNPHLICPPSTAASIVTFFIGNYFVHAGTVLTRPGASNVEQIAVAIAALMLPASGLARALTVIYRFSTVQPLLPRLGCLGKEKQSSRCDMASATQQDLRRAACAGALCTLIRTTKWRPQLFTENSELEAIGGCFVLEKSERQHYNPDSEHRSNIVLDDLQAGTAEIDQHSRTCDTHLHTNGTPIAPETTAANPSNGPDTKRRCNMTVYLPTSMTQGSNLWSSVVDKSISVHGRIALPRSEDYGYALAILPPSAIVDSEMPIMSNTTTSQVRLSCSYSVAKSILAILQFAFALVTLVRASEGDQVKRYGYSSFALTVSPYAVMSLVNLIASIMCPQYPSLYMVRNSVMDEAEERFGRTFDGVIGRLRPVAMQNLSVSFQEESSRPINIDYLSFVADYYMRNPGYNAQELSSATSYDLKRGKEFSKLRSILVKYSPLFANWCGGDRWEPTRLTSRTRRDWNPLPASTSHRIDDDTLPLILVPACEDFESYPDGRNLLPKWINSIGFYAIIGMPFVITGIVSKYRTGPESTHAQRAWLMSWMVIGQFMGYVGLRIHLAPQDNRASGSSDGISIILGLLESGVLVWSVPAIGGFVVVAQMLSAYGNCIRIY